MIGNLMRNSFLASAAMFSPPDSAGSDAGDGGEQTVDTGGAAAGESADAGDAGDTGGATGGDAGDAGAAPAATEDHSKPRVETVTDSVRRAVAESKEKAAATKDGKGGKKDKTQTDGATAGDKVAAKAGSETPADGDPATAPQATSGPPNAWNKEAKAIWEGLPDVAKQAITQRETDTAKGVQELRTRYQDIDTAIAPYKAVMTQNNVTPGQAINQLFKWHMELAGPNKVQAFRELAKSFSIDPATIAAAPEATAEKPAGVDQGNNEIPENLRPVITDLETRLKKFEENESAATKAAAQQTWVNWSKDKPHAEKVRGLMANLINSDLALMQAGQPQVSNTIKNGTIDMDAAYQAATFAHPEVRQALLQEDQTRRDKEARAAAEKAKKASAGLRTGAPAGAVDTSKSNAPRVESVKESITRALAEVRGSTQH